MRNTIALIALSFVGLAVARLPPPTEEAKAMAAEATAKSAWSDKIAQYQLCVAMDRTADQYRKSLTGVGKDAPAAVATAPCTNPGPYVSPISASASKPLEAAGAHSPSGTATSPPSGQATSAELSQEAKK